MSDNNISEDSSNLPIDEADNKMGSIKSKVKKLNKTVTDTKENEDMEITGEEHPFMCGVLEGFYGRPWTAEQRKELFRRMEEMGLNTYLYGPKDDYKHRLFWREKYSEDEAELLKTLIQEAETHNVVFVYAISPGLDLTFTSEKEISALKEKLLQVKALGCKAFALLFDDIDPVLNAADMEEFKSSADAQASITNLMFNALDKPRFLFCPTEYCNSMANPDVLQSHYLKTIGTKLDPHISVMWTGSKVVSNIITVDSIKQLNRILKRKVMIWDNIHANDYDPKRVFLGPFKGRSTNLIDHLSGILTNPNCEFESNFVAMHTVATWWKSYTPVSNNPDRAANDGAEEAQLSIDASSSKEKSASAVDNCEVKSDAAKEPTNQKRSSSFEVPLNDAESVGSGRVSATDTDSDSDYSSHDDDGFFFTLSDNEHGCYDPNTALEKALQDWLPVFSWLRYPTRKVVPRSGAPQAIPPIPNVPLNTRPVVPDLSVTTMSTEPVFSVGQMGEPPNKTIKTESENATTVIDESAKAGEDAFDCATPNAIDDRLESDFDEPERSTSRDVKAATPSPLALEEDELELNDVKTRGDVTEPSSNKDVEMKELVVASATDEKVLEEMQASPKYVIPDQMETEDVPEQTTPMVTDDLDSDVSMATAQSGSAVPTDEDMSASSPATGIVAADRNSPDPSKESDEPEKSKARENIFESVPPDLGASSKSSSKERIVEKYEEDPMTVDDLRLLAECFYLPYEHGAVGKSLVHKFKWLRENAFKLSRTSDKKSEHYLDKALDWSQRALAFEEHCREIQAVFNKICACPNRALLYDLYPYLWDLRGVITMLRSYVRWLGHVEVKPQSPGNDDRGMTAARHSKPGFGFLGPDPEPWAFRGGLSGDLQRLLPISSAFDLFCQTLPVEPQVCTFVVRPYLPADERPVYEVCYATADDGASSNEDFAEYKDLPGDRLVGALLTLSPEYCFVAEDDSGICGCLVAALDAKQFWKKYEVAFLPELQLKYDKPTETEGELTEAQKAILDLFSTEDRFGYATDELNTTYPSLLTLALHPRANTNILKSMLACLLSALKSHHSCGVHTVVLADSQYSCELYTKLGLTKVLSKSEDISTEKSVKILGRTF